MKPSFPTQPDRSNLTTPSGRRPAPYRRFLASLFILLIIFAARPTTALAQLIIYVDVDATAGSNNGSSWGDAYTSLKSALAAATSGDQIWVAEGVYTPVTPADPDNVTEAERLASFYLISGLKIYGGFSGTEGTGYNLNNRDFDANTTIFSGDIDGNDAPFEPNVDSDSNPDTPTQTDHLRGSNSFHVFNIKVGTNATALLDGVTITAGNAVGDLQHRYGGGMVNYIAASPTLSNVIFTGNHASQGGGGMSNSDIAVPSSQSAPILTNVTFSSNTSSYGGGLRNTISSPILTDVTFFDNRAESMGGGMYNDGNDGSITGGIFFGNKSDSFGGGIHNNFSSSLTLTNVTLFGNLTDGVTGGISNHFSDPTLTNVILWGNKDNGTNIGRNDLSNLESSTTITHSLVGSSGGSGDGWNDSFGTDGGGNIDADPRFLSTDPEDTGFLHLRSSSPAINTGSNEAYEDAGGDLQNDTDLAGNPRLYDGAPAEDIIDMGAYEFQDEPGLILQPNDNILYVNQDVDDSAPAYTGTGDSWANAVKELAVALQWARGGVSGWSEADPLQIWVASGTYKPLYAAGAIPPGHPSPSRNQAFVLVPDVQVYGGFAANEAGLNDRNAAQIHTDNQVVLSGDLGTEGESADNAYHVVISAGDVGSAALDGLAITGGHANGSLSVSVYGETVLEATGGGVAAINSSPRLLNVMINGNSAQTYGGGLHSVDSAPQLVNGSLTDNHAALGGAIYSAGSDPQWINLTLAGNTAEAGGGIFHTDGSTAKLINSIVWGNTADEGTGDIFTDADLNLSHSLVGEGGCSSVVDSGGTLTCDGTDVIGGIPQFTDPDNGDYTLQSNSPVINAGTNVPFETGEAAQGITTDLAGNSRIYDGAPDPDIIDMGAYEFQGEPADVTFTKTFAGLVQAGNTVTLGFTIENHSAGTLTDLTFTDDLDAMLPGAQVTEASAANDVCGPGSVLSGTNLLSLTGATLSGDNSCTFSVTLQVPADAASGDYINTTGSLTGTMDDLAVTFHPATDTLTVEGLLVPSGANILYVDKSVTGGNESGDSWANAIPELADALKWAREQHDTGSPDWDKENPLRIFVATGTYLPMYNAEDGSYTTDGGRENTFVLVPNVQIYGGFDPDNAIEMLDDDRILPFDGEGTVLSGNLGTEGDDSDNTYHVVVSAGAAGSAVLDGLTITEGYAFANPGDVITINGETIHQNRGGGMAIHNSSPALAHILLTSNSANEDGGGIYNTDSSPSLTNVTFKDNSAEYNGGGMNIHTLLNTEDSAPSLTNVIFTGNQADEEFGYGGGLNNSGAPTFTNVTFTGNHAGTGGGISNSGSLMMTNSIVWGNDAGFFGKEIYNGGTINLYYSLYRDGEYIIYDDNNGFTADEHSIITDPQFTDSGAGDYSLLATSPAINAGDPATDLSLFPTDSDDNPIDLAGNPRVQNGAIDMGAYEFQGDPETPLTLTVGEGWRMLSSPVAGQSYAGMLDSLWTQGVDGADYSGGDPNVYTWNTDYAGDCVTEYENNLECEGWQVPSAASFGTAIPAGSGFLVYVFEDDEYGETEENPFPKDLTLSGPRHSGNVSPDINTNPNGWTLVGNPYGRPVAFGNLERTDVNDAAYIYDPNADLPDGEDSGPVNGNGGAWRSSVDGLYGDIPGGVIAPGQGFFVQTASSPGGTPSPSLTFSESDQTGGGEFYGKENEPRDFVRLEVQGEGLYNSAWIRFSSEGSLEQTGGEALELQPLSANYAMLGARKTDGTLMDIAHFPLDTQNLEIPLAVATTQSGHYTIQATDLELPAGMALYLYDKNTSESMPIGDDSFEYSFSVTAGEPKTKVLTVKEILAAGAAGPGQPTTNGTDRFLITTSPGGPASELPNKVALGQNYPNPFNPATVIRYQLPQQSQVRLDVFDMLGRRVATLVDEQVAAGTHQVNLNAGNLSSGVYLYRLQVLSSLGEGGQTGSQIITKKLTLIK